MAIAGVVPDFNSYILFGIALAIYLSWYTRRHWKNMHIGPSEPPLIPYRIPGLGHTLSFLRDPDRTINHALAYLQSGELAFRLFVGGQTIYIATDPTLISEIHKQAKEISNDNLLELLLTAIGVPGPTRARLWSLMTPKTKEPIPRAITTQLRKALRAHPETNTLIVRALAQMNRTLTPLAVSDPSRRAMAEPAEVSLFKWTMDIIVETITDGLLGKVCLDRFPDIKDTMFDFHMNLYAIFQPRPRMFARKAYDASDRLVQSFTEYFYLPREKRMDCAKPISDIEYELRESGVSSEELSMMFVWVYWGMLGNSATVTFWLLCHIICRPELLSSIREECEKAFPEDRPVAPPDIPTRLEGCPMLRATFQEAMRLYAGKCIFRHVYEDTEIGPYRLKKDSTLLIPYDRLHLNKEYWGPDAGEFNPRRFLYNPELANSRFFKPFGDGAHQCGGRLMAPLTMMYFVATVVCGYNVAIIGGVERLPFPRVDKSKGTAAAILPVISDVPQVTISPRVRVR